MTERNPRPPTLALSLLRVLLAALLMLGGVWWLVTSETVLQATMGALVGMLGLTAFAGVAVNPSSGMRDQALRAAYFPLDGTRDRLEHQARLYGRMALIQHGLGLIWILIGICIVLSRGAAWSASDRSASVLSILVGATVFFGLGSLCWLVQLVASWKALHRK